MIDPENQPHQLFQFLIGRLKTYQLHYHTTQRRWFQFLIGRLKTPVPPERFKVIFQFQFLIGRLKTFCSFVCRRHQRQFQFLIGRLKTKLYQVQAFLNLVVSIPYRQAKNQLFSRLVVQYFCQFQFLIGRLKTLVGAETQRFIQKFQFLIGRLKTGPVYTGPSLRAGVSIPYRQAKNVVVR